MLAGVTLIFVLLLTTIFFDKTIKNCFDQLSKHSHCNSLSALLMWKWAVIRNEEMNREQYLPRLMVVRDSQQTRKRNRDYTRFEDYSRRWDILWLNCITTWENYSKIWRKLPSSDWFVTPASMSVCDEQLTTLFSYFVTTSFETDIATQLQTATNNLLRILEVCRGGEYNQRCTKS